MWTPALGCLGVNMNNIKKVCFICFLFLVFNLAATADEFEFYNMNAALPISVTPSGITTLTAPLSVHFFSTPSSISKISVIIFFYKNSL